MPTKKLNIFDRPQIIFQFLAAYASQGHPGSDHIRSYSGILYDYWKNSILRPSFLRGGGMTLEEGYP